MLPDGASVATFERDGYCLVRQLLDPHEARLLRQVTATNPAIHADPTRVDKFSYLEVLRRKNLYHCLVLCCNPSLFRPLLKVSVNGAGSMAHCRREP